MAETIVIQCASDSRGMGGAVLYAPLSWGWLVSRGRVMKVEAVLATGQMNFP